MGIRIKYFRMQLSEKAIKYAKNVSTFLENGKQFSSTYVI